MLMGSRLRGVPVSATEAAPPVAPFSTSTGIRAPLTSDDSEFEYSVDDDKDGAFSSNESDSGFESDGFLSGENGSEDNTSERRPFLADPPEVEGYVVSRPSVRIPRVEINHGSVFGRNFDDSTPFLRDPDERIIAEDVLVGEHNHPRPFPADSSEAAAETSMENNENATLVRLPVLDNENAFMNRHGMPIAILSRDSDDEIESNGSVDDEPILGVARVASSGNVWWSGSAPKVRNLEVAGEDNTSLSDSGSEGESVEDTILVGVDNGLSKSRFQDKRIADDLLAAEVIEDEAPFIAEEARSRESCDEIQEFNTKNSLECKDDEKNHNTADITDKETKIINILWTNGVKEVGQAFNCDVLEDKVTEAAVVDNSEEASKDYGNRGNKNIDGNGTVFCCELDESEDLKSEIEQKIDQKLETHNKDALKETHNKDALKETHNKDVLKNFQSMEAIRENEVQLMNSVKLSDSPVVQEPGCLMNGYSGDVSEESPQSDLQVMDARIVSDSRNLQDALSHSEGEEVCSSCSLQEPLRTATGVKLESSDVMFTSSNSTTHFPLEQAFTIGSRITVLGPTAPPSTDLFTGGPIVNGESAEILTQAEKMKFKKLQEIAVKFLWLMHSLKRSLEDSVAEKILHQLQLVVGRPYAQAFNFDFAKQMALVLEAEGKNDFNFSLNALVIGKSGVGKSATINSIFGEEKARIDASEPGTTSVKKIMGTLDGIQLWVLDTPGLSSSLTDQSNYKILSSIKKFTKKLPPDVVLYVDRLDTQTSILNDLPLVKLITNSLGSSIWSRTIVTLTHAASIPPEGSSGYPLSYDFFVAKMSHAVQQLISHSVGNFDIIKPGLIPVSLIENCSTSGMEEEKQAFSCRKESWRSQLLLLCYSMKILSEIDCVVETNRDVDYQKFGFKVPSPSLPHLIASFLQSIVHPKLSTMDGCESVDSDTELAYSSDCDQESEVKGFQDGKKKQKEGADDNGYMEEDANTKMDSPGAVAAPLPERVLPPAFDGENPSYRYCSLESSLQFLEMPVVDLHAWDHDSGYDGLSIEDNLAIAVQLKKDKHESIGNLNSAVSVKHGEKGSTMIGLDIETVGTQLAYILTTETKLRKFKVKKTAAGAAITLLGENAIAGVKAEDHLALGKNLALVGSSGLIQCENDTAYGVMLGIRLREKDYPINQGQTILELSLTRWKGDLACRLNMQSQFSVRRNSKLSFQAGFKGKQNGLVSIRLSSSDQPLIATLGLLPIVRTICRALFMLLRQRQEH